MRESCIVCHWDVRRPDQCFLTLLQIFLRLSWLLFPAWFFVFIIIEMDDVQSSDTSSIPVSHSENSRNFKKPSHFLSKFLRLQCPGCPRTYLNIVQILHHFSSLHSLLPLLQVGDVLFQRKGSMCSKYWQYFLYLLTLDLPEHWFFLLIILEDNMCFVLLVIALHNMVKKSMLIKVCKSLVQWRLVSILSVYVLL